VVIFQVGYSASLQKTNYDADKFERRQELLEYKRLLLVSSVFAFPSFLLMILMFVPRAYCFSIDDSERVAFDSYLYYCSI
jgi:hypothetical protein